MTSPRPPRSSRPNRPEDGARRAGWVIVALLVLAVGGYAVALVATGFRLGLAVGWLVAGALG